MIYQLKLKLTLLLVDTVLPMMLAMFVLISFLGSSFQKIFLKVIRFENLNNSIDSTFFSSVLLSGSVSRDNLIFL